MSTYKKKIKFDPNRSFGFLFFVVFLIIALWPLYAGYEIRIWSILLSLIFLILAIIKPKILSPLNRIWIRFGIFLSIIVSPIVMGLVFFGVLTPTAFFIKLFGKDLLRKKYSDEKSYWIKREKNVGPMKKQF